jgi:2,3,4,5-tetrahydropyridine-2,6-dicarboxylate N-acetyltransferase
MSEFTLVDGYAIAKYIKEAKKQTPVKLYLNGQLESIDFSHVKAFGDNHSKVIFGDIQAIDTILQTYKDLIKDHVLEYDRRNSAIPLLNTTHINARIEPGAYIREHAIIGERSVIMMGAVINIGAIIGEGTMIDMNAVVGARGTIVTQDVLENTVVAGSPARFIKMKDDQTKQKTEILQDLRK